MKTLWLAPIVLVTLAAPLIAAEKAAQRPNIVFFLIDDQRNDTLGCAGHPIIKTPTVDRLAAEGVRFENAFVTTSICAASRATIFTGLYERTHGYTFGTPPISKEYAEASYPAVLRRDGYRTGFIGKFGVSVAGGATADMFDVFQPHGRNPYLKKQPDGSLRHETEISGDKAIEFIQSNPAGRPFCLSISFNAAHAEDGDKRPGIGHYPWPKAVDGMYDDVTIPPPRLGDPAIYESQPDFLKKSLNRERYFWRWDTPEKYQINMRAYFRMISGIDRVIGRVQDVLEAQGLAENTVIIYIGDNGYYMGDRGFAGKWSHYEQSLRVPLIIYDPRLGKELRGRVLDPMALNVDLPPTMLDLAGAQVPEHYQGKSLVPWLRGEEVTDWRKDFFCEHLMEVGARIPKWEGVRGERYVYARYFENDFEFLHDLQVDPDELKNFADDPAYADVLAKMRKRCDELRDSYGGPYKPRPKPPKGGAAPAKQGATSVEGVVGKAAAFDGRSYLEAGTVPALEPGDDFSRSLWVKLGPGHVHSGVIVGNRQTRAVDSATFVKFTSHSFQFYGDREHAVRLDYSLAEGRWTHLAAVKSGPELTCYVDGEPVARGTADFPVPKLPLYIGGDPVAGEMSTCSVDEVRTFTAALSPEQIRTLAEGQPIDDALHGHWPLDE